MLLANGAPLLVEADESPTGWLGVLEENSFLRDCNSQFLARLPKVDDGTRVAQPGSKCVVVLQGELARLDRKREPHRLLVGSEDATTCVLVVAECTESGLLSTAHIDEGVNTPGAMAQLLHGMLSPQLYLCGAYCDKGRKGPQLAERMLHLLHADPRPMHIRLACLGKCNTKGGKPVARDLLLDAEQRIPLPIRVSAVTSGELEPLPAWRLRHARLWLTMQSREGELFDVYDKDIEGISVKPFRYSLDTRLGSFLQVCLRMPISEMLQYTSTSPEDERDEFPHVQRETFMWILEHPEHGCVFTGEASGGLKYRWQGDHAEWIREMARVPERHAVAP